MLQEKLARHVSAIQSLLSIEKRIEQAATLLAESLSRGGKILLCGNGGSAADAQHFAAEIVGRFQKERRAWAALALTTDTSILTALGNDYGFDEVFARQVEGLGKPGDVLLGISTSGDSANVLKAVKSAKAMQISTVGLLGKQGGQLAHLVDLPLIVDCQETATIQEAHIFLLHHRAEQVENRLAGLS